MSILCVFQRFVQRSSIYCHNCVNKSSSRQISFFNAIFPQLCTMFNRLKERWKVNTVNLILILFTFALGGSTCARLGKAILGMMGMDSGPIGWISYLILITLLWPICVLLISIPLGQFSFFRNYIRRIGSKMSGKKGGKTQKLAIFASGKGSNAENIILFSKKTRLFSVEAIITNNPGSGVVQIAQKYDIQCITVKKEDLELPEALIYTLKNKGVNWIVLAGFLKKIPDALIQVFPGKIINIHPALLPEFGGKGMYGQHVHQSVIASGKKESGITIHLVDEHYDNGDIIFSATCEISPEDDATSLERKVRALELRHYPEVIADFMKKQMVR